MGRLRGRKLQERRERWFRDHPLCVHCRKLGRVTEAAELDHVVPLFKGGPDDETNLQGLCGPCHEVKTAIDLGYSKKTAVGLDGWPVAED